MREVGGNSGLWLIKAGDRILGPYPHADVVRKLLSREIAVIDEIAKPSSRWRYVREEPAFLAIVEQIRHENMNVRDDTVATMTNTPTHVESDEVTPTPTPTPVSPHLIEKPTTPQPAKRYGLQSESPPVNEQKSNTPMLLLTLMLAISVFLYWQMKERSKGVGTAPAASFSSLKSTGLRAISAGEYRQALVALKEAQNLSSSDVDVQLGLAAMLLKVENQTAAARRLIDDLEKLTPEQKKKSDALLSFADLISNEASQAIERLKDYSKIEDEYDKVIAFNSAVAFKLKSQPKEARKRLLQIIDDSKYGPPARILLAIISESTSSESAIDAIKSVLSPEAYRPRPFQQEALVLQSYLQMKSGNQKSAEAAITATLAADPYATSYFTYDPAMYLQAINWVQLRSYCEQLEAKFEKSVEAKTFLALCELKSDRQARALELMNDALAQAPQDQLLLANNAYLLLEFGKDEEAKGSLRLAMRTSDNELSLLLMAKACFESGDAICERESYKKILHLDANHLTALVGLAELELRAGDAQAAQIHYKQAVSLNPSFAPVLRLKEKLP